MLKVKHKKGFISIEAVIALVALIFIILLFVGFYVYQYPCTVLENRVHDLAQQAKITGGLTSAQVTDFNKELQSMGYKSTVKAYVAGTDRVALNVAPRDTAYVTCTNTAIYNPFIRRDSTAKIVIVATVKANDGTIKGPIKWFQAKMLPDNYVISETVMSERNRC